MAQYIDKDALILEIERKMEERDNSRDEAIWNNELWSETEYSYRSREDEVIIDLINTLEVKEVDLEKELIKWHKQHFKKDGTFIGMSGFYLTNSSQMDIAKHFFELGMEVNNKAQKGEEV